MQTIFLLFPTSCSEVTVILISSITIRLHLFYPIIEGNKVAVAYYSLDRDFSMNVKPFKMPIVN